MSRTVLLVDDSDVCSTLMEIALSDLQEVTTVTVRSVQNALTCLANPERPISLVITDLELPDADGISLVRHMRQTPAHANTPIVVVTGVPASFSQAKLAAHRIAAYFEKPCSPNLLRRTVQGLLDAR